MIAMHSVKRELPKSSILYTYIEDEEVKSKIWVNDLN